MKKFTSPLDNLKIASPCPAEWNKMYGNDRKRLCSSCNLNVYNLSDMTKREAENFLMNSEGRVCVNFHRRKDGTILIKDCPVGWQKLKRQVSRISTAIFASIFGLFGGIFSFQLSHLNLTGFLHYELIEIDKKHDSIEWNRGRINNLEEIKKEIIEEEGNETEFTGYFIKDS